MDGPRPCPWVSCRYSTFFDRPAKDGRRRLEVLGEVSSLKLDALADEWLESWDGCSPSCVLDVADEAAREEQPSDLEEVASALGMTPGAAEISLRRVLLKYKKMCQDDQG